MITIVDICTAITSLKTAEFRLLNCSNEHEAREAHPTAEFLKVVMVIEFKSGNKSESRNVAFHPNHLNAHHWIPCMCTPVIVLAP